MVVSFDIYEIFSFMELIFLVIYSFFAIFKRQEKFNKVTRLTLSGILLIVNLVQIPMKVQLEKSYVMSMVFVFIWFAIGLMNSYDLGENH